MMPVYLSQTAYDQLHETLDYLETNWSTIVSDNFLDKLERAIEVMGNMPYAYPESQNFLGFENASSPANQLLGTK